MAGGAKSSMNKEDTLRLYDKLEDIVRAVSDLDKSIALINQSNETREKQMLEIGSRLGSLEEAQRFDEIWKSRLRGVWLPIAAILTFIVGILGAVIHDYIRTVLSTTTEKLAYILINLLS